MTKPEQLQSPQNIVDKTKQISLKETANINSKVAQQQIANNSKLTNEAVKEANNITNRFISHQILAEPIRVVSPESIINAAIAAINVLGQAILNPAKEKLEKIAGLSQNPSAIDSYQIYDCVDKATKKCAAIADTQTNNAILANGHTINAAFNTAIQTANSIHVVSDTATVNRAPLFSLSAQDTSIQSNNSFNLISDINYNQFKQDVKFVEGTTVSQSQTSLKVSTETNDDIAKVNRTVGVNEVSSLGKINKVIGDSELLAASGGSAQVAAYGNLGMQSNADISILSTKPDTNSPVEASGEKAQATTNGGNIYIVSNPSSDFTNMLVMSNKGWLSASTGNLFNSSTEYNITTGKKGSIVSSEKFTYFGNPQGGTFTVGGRTFLGKLSFPVVSLDAAKVVDIPALPILPSIPSQQLENCLPKKTNTFEDYKPIENGITQGTNNDAVFNAETFVTPLSIPTPVNKIQLPNTFPDYFSSNKLPAPLVSSSTDKLDSGLAFINSFTPANILVDRYTTQSKLNIVNLTNSEEVYNFSNFINLLSEEDLLTQFASSLVSPSDLITNQLINTYLENVIPSALLDTLHYAQFYIDLAKLSIDKLESFTITLEDFISSDKDKVQAILDLIQLYPELKEQIIELVKQVNALPAIGFLGAISNISSFVSSGIGTFGNITNAIKIVQAGDFTQITNLVKPLLNNVLKNTPFRDILNNTDLLTLGQGILLGDYSNLSTILLGKLDNLYQTKIKTVIESELSGLLGDYSFIYSSLKEIFNKVKIGEKITPQNYIPQIAQLLDRSLGSDSLTKAASIYQGIEDLLKDISSGDVLSILTGTNIDNLVSSVAGSEAAGSLTKIFNLVKDITGTVDAIKLLPELLNLVNEYNIPSIEQVASTLNCLDLFSKIKSLVDSLGGLGGSSKATASLVENIGRLIQAANSIDSVNEDTLSEWSTSISQEIEESINLQEYKSILNNNLKLNDCFKLPKLNVFQASVEIVEIRSSSIVFKLTNLDILKSQIYLLPKINDFIQLRVQGFYSVIAREYLTPYQTDYQYTPSVYTYVVSDFNLNSNIGMAYYDKAYSSIVLENVEGILYKFNTESIGSTLSPDIVDSYLLA